MHGGATKFIELLNPFIDHIRFTRQVAFKFFPVNDPSVPFLFVQK